MTTVRWRQAVDGIPAADSELRVNVTRDGRVLSVLGAPAHDLDPATTPTLTAGEAVRAVQDDVGVYRSLPRDRGPAGATRRDDLRRRHDRGARALQRPARVARDLPRGLGRRLRRARRRRQRQAPAAGEPRQVRGAGEGLEELPGRGRRRHGARPSISTPVADQQHPVGRARTCTRTPTSTTTTSRRRARRSSRAATTSSRVHRHAAARRRSRAPGRGRHGHHAGRPTAQQNAVQAFYLANRFHDHLAAAPIGFTDRQLRGHRPAQARDRRRREHAAQTRPHQQREHVHAARRQLAA